MARASSRVRGNSTTLLLAFYRIELTALHCLHPQWSLSHSPLHTTPTFCCCPQDAEQQYGDYLVAYNDSVVAIDEALAIGVEVSGDEEELLGEEPAQVKQVQKSEKQKVDEAEELRDADNEKAA